MVLWCRPCTQSTTTDDPNVAYRDNMEAARRRVEALERELRELATTRTGDGPAPDKVYAKVVALAESLEAVQAELQRRRREHETLWREAALAEIRRRELDHMRRQLSRAKARAERERSRADFAEIALMRTQMRLAIERARAGLNKPWPASAIRTHRDEVRRAAGAETLEALPEEALRAPLERLTLLVADTLWNPPTDPAADREALLATLRGAGHELAPDGDRHLGPADKNAPGLRIAFGPLALRLTLRRADGVHSVTVHNEGPLRYETSPLSDDD